MITDRELERLHKALANRRRIAIVRYLKSGSATVGEIAKSIKLSLKSTSRHLQVLSSAGFVIAEQHGLYMHYSLDIKSNAICAVRSGIF